MADLMVFVAGTALVLLGIGELLHRRLITVEERQWQKLHQPVSYIPDAGAITEPAEDLARGA